MKVSKHALALHANYTFPKQTSVLKIIDLEHASLTFQTTARNPPVSGIPLVANWRKAFRSIRGFSNCNQSKHMLP